MTKPLPFTAAAVARAIEGVRKAGLAITATSVAPDGTVTIFHYAVVAPTPPVQDDVASEWADMS
jgi:hypothetical protein